MLLIALNLAKSGSISFPYGLQAALQK